MRDHMPIRTRMKSWRTAVAVAGVAAMAVTLGQSVSTLANPNEVVSTDGSQIATGNFFPTPLPATINCERDYDWSGNTGAMITWSTAGPGMKYRVLILRDNDESKVREDFYTTETSYRYRSSGGTASDRVRIYTVNITSGSDDPLRVRSSGYVSHTTYTSSSVLTRCSGDPRYDAPNSDWEDTTVWDPSTDAPASAGRQTVMAAPRSAPAAELDRVEEDPAEVNAEAGEREVGETRTSADEATEAASPSSTPATARPAVAPRSSVTAAPSPLASTRSSTTAKSTPAPTSSRPPSSDSPATTTTQSPNKSVRLPGGGQAEIVDGAKLVVSGTGAPQCSVTVRRGSTLELRDGVLEVADSVEARAVDLESCELSEV
ncbi:hypothetical protein ACWIFB_11355 [Dietzia sp. NPDC055340]